MAESLANLCLETLRDLLVEETKFLLSVSGDVDQVKRDLSSMHALLMRADRERRDSDTLKDYVSQLKGLAFKAETVIEAYAVNVGFQRSLKEKLQRYICIMCECYNIHAIGKDTRDIISRLSQLKNSLESEFRQESSSGSTHQQDLARQEFSHEIEHHFVGMAKDIEIFVSMVKDESRRQRVVKIYGMGGLGKTTLARKIYNHGDFQSYARAWVCITQQFQPKAILARILKQLDRSAHNDSMDVSELVEGIHRFLEQKEKCLVVLDDIWENDHWDIIKKAFPKNCNVLLTTRSECIAHQECGHPHKLRYLTEEEGWDLLQKIAIPQDSGRVQTGLKSLEDIGREIVRKCECLPLSISVIGGILRQKEESLAEWKNVKMNMDLYLRHGEGVEEYRRVKQVLALSYDALPYYLKPCFLYLSYSREDEEIEAERLYLLWMAEGFISYQDKEPNETLRDVAERYLSELGMRCMVQVQKPEISSPRNKFVSCRLHDLMHNLCTLKAEKETILKRIQISKDGVAVPSSTGISRSRTRIPSSNDNSTSRLAITFDDDAITEGSISIEVLEGLKDLRSLMFLGEYIDFRLRIGFEDSKIDFDKLRCLRILALDCCEFKNGKLPSKVGKLIHLRYLSLRNSRVRELPQFVCGLLYLQTLDLRVWDTIRLPNVIWKMKKLMHLFLPSTIEVIGGDKLRLDGLDELETLDLDSIDADTVRFEDVPKLSNLRTLRVEVYDTDSLLISVQLMINNKSRACKTSLHVSLCELSRDVLNNMLMSPSLVTLNTCTCNVSGGFPYYRQGMCENLLSLELIDCTVRGDMMEELGKYPVLQYLLVQARQIEMPEILIFRSNSFPQLKCLRIYDLHNLKIWEVEEGAMPKLTQLLIVGCINLERVPAGLRFISTLQQLYLVRMPDELKDRVREGGQDYATVSHIPSINYGD